MDALGLRIIASCDGPAHLSSTALRHVSLFRCMFLLLRPLGSRLLGNGIQVVLVDEKAHQGVIHEELAGASARLHKY